MTEPSVSFAGNLTDNPEVRSTAAAGLTAEDGSARSAVEVVAEELGPSPRWATAGRHGAPRQNLRHLAGVVGSQAC